MKEHIKKNQNLLFLLKCLLCAYIVTGGFLLLLALMLYRFQLKENVVSIAIIAIYVVATFASGFLSGKRMGSRKFLWGLLMGALYFLLLVVVSFVVNHSIQDMGSNFFTTLFLCTGSGMLGGMLS